MKCCSFNCKGLASPLKRPALKRVIDFEHPDILLLQETLGEGEEVSSRLSSLLPGWKFETLDSFGRSGGLAIGWNTRSIKFINSWGFESGIGITVLSTKLEDPLNIVNIYDPCQNRGPYWDKTFSKYFLKDQQVIFGGDLNFSLGFSEVWGTHARADPLTSFFTQKLVECNLLDLEPVKLKPTWRNNRVGDASVAKRLDRFMIKEILPETPLQMKQWIGYGGISYHCPIFLEIRKGSIKPPIPFKFNRTWLTDDFFTKLVRENWSPFTP
jgi:exonuclease III